ncbi:Por secretion system C-terminal sorting domain-containing protein [Lishizhenia tianjinensis]|uniref:Por secretion system C-terminal sorting domain-containing protein n=1 Tax=Lishizhenia tianjinensis TaxID=477690 RepID=A0A1I6ZSI0_9FLAO|nr:T9SS type A sorting domain-containing protein [Lishizhenia tianjinensis]SFT65668.1 Por secretion system C-terminal sorting domain-containing protein [Lishizhenia tianjinensis]
MKLIKRLTLAIACGVLSALAFGQTTDWRTYNSQAHQNFFDLQESFEDEFGGQPYIPGKGIKQFRRWEYYWESRVNPDGTFPSPGHVLNEMLMYRAAHPQPKSYVAGSGTWSLVGPKSLPTNLTGQLNGNGRLTAIAFHPTDTNIIYVGAPAGGFWKTTDHGATWTEYSGGLTRLGVSSIVVHPTQPDTIYIGTGDRDAGDAPGYGVWRSTDGGVTWAAHNTGMGNVTVNEIIMNPNHADSMYAAASNQKIYRTTNGGATWTASTTLGMNPKDIAIHPSNPNIVYAAGSQFHKSTNGGANFTQITSGVPTGASRIAVAVSADEPNWVYLLAGDGSGLMGIYRSSNSGVSFAVRSTSPNILGYPTDGSDTRSQAWYDLVLAANPLDADEIYTGGINIWKSTDGGMTLNCASYWVGTQGSIDGVHADQHVLEFSPHNNILYNGNDGGIYFTQDDGVNWTDISSGLAIAQIYKIGVSQQTKDLAITGFQDNGTGYATGANAFYTVIGGDGMECIIDPTDDNFMYGALYYGNIRRSTNGGNNFSNISNAISEDGAWVTPYKLDPNNSNTMLVGMENMWRSTNVKTTASFTQISTFSGTQKIRDIAIAPSNSDVVYVSRRDNKLWKSTNATSASPTWTDLASLPINNEPADIEIDPTDPNHVFIALNNNIYESNNGGASWVDISGTLPNIALNTIVIDHASSVNAMYVGMDVGVYYIDDNLTDWVSYQTNLPSCEVTELEIQYDNVNCGGQLLAGTYGQGLWKSDLKDPGNLAPVACFTSTSATACEGTVVQFTDLSNFTPTSWSWSISPATHQYTNGTTASSQHPEVIFGAGTYTVSLTVTNAQGTDVETKTAYLTVGTADYPCAYNEDFEAETACATTTNCGVTVCGLASNWVNLTNGSEDDIDWRVDAGGTPSAGTGPSVDNTTGTATGKYVYLEASNGCFQNTAILESSCIKLTQAYNFSFAYHMFGTHMGKIHVDLFYNNEWHEDYVPELTGNQGDQWLTQTVDLSAHQGETVKLRIRGRTGWDFESDIAIDDIMFTPILGTPTLATACDTYTSPSGNYVWNTTGIYTDTITGAGGCDSLVAIDLTVLGADNTTENITSCGNYIWPANGQMYTSDGSYSTTLTNVNGCDSVANLNLTISTAASSTQNENVCSSYTWPLNGLTYTTSGTHSVTVTSISGCDSTVTLNLTVAQPTTATQQITNCDAYVWPVNGQTYNTSGNYTAVIPNAAGCDSTITLQLTINPAATTTQTEMACGSYVWAANNQSYTSSGLYTASLQTVNGCDSLVTLDLQVNPAYNFTETVNYCGDYTWVEDGNTYSATGVYTTTYTSVFGCDSVRTLDLFIEDVDAVVTQSNDITLNTFAGGSLQYQWVDCNNNYAPIAGETGSTFVATANGSYALIATGQNCSDTSECFVISTIATDEVDAFEFNIYPNPVSDKLFITLPTEQGPVTARLFDAKGALVESFNFENGQKIEMLFPYAKGVYTLELQVDGKVVSEKIIKQ